MLKLIHGADFHLDSPFSGLSPELAARRRGEQRTLLDDLARLAREEEAQLVLLSGDLLDGHRIYRETAQTLARSLGSIPCPVFIAPGNHDHYSPRSVYATLDWPDNVHIFTSEQVESVALPELNCVVHGRALTAPYDQTGPLEGFPPCPRDGRLHLMVAHGDLTADSRYGPLSSADIAASGLDYLALGHIHRYSGLNREGHTFWAYPGCPEGRGFDETGEKGVLCLEAEPGRVTSRFLPLGRHRYEALTVDVTGADPLSAVTAALPGDTSRYSCRITLTGECESLDPASLEGALTDRFCSLSLIDRTRLPRDLWQRRGEDSLTGLFLQTMWAHAQARPHDPVVQQAVRFGLAALERGEDAAP